jgi:hypothetical protein
MSSPAERLLWEIYKPRRPSKGVLLVKIPKDDKDEFKKLCQKHGVSMEEILRKLIHQAVYHRPIGVDLFEEKPDV